MQTRTNAILVVVTLLVYFSGLRPAHAFYDPGMQRWLNRDPLTAHSPANQQFAKVKLQFEAKEGPNIYVFVRNGPYNFIDAFGLTLCCIKEVHYWEANSYSSEAECALEEYNKFSVNQPGYFIIGLPIAWGFSIYDTFLFYRQQAMCRKYVCVGWR